MKLDLDKLYQDISQRGGKAPVRYVSYKEYKILEQMNKEGMLTICGHPKAEFFDEYIKRMKDNGL